jgi:hypothetical protein
MLHAASLHKNKDQGLPNFIFLWSSTHLKIHPLSFFETPFRFTHLCYKIDSYYEFMLQIDSYLTSIQLLLGLFPFNLKGSFPFTEQCLTTLYMCNESVKSSTPLPIKAIEQRCFCLKK